MFRKNELVKLKAGNTLSIETYVIKESYMDSVTGEFNYLLSYMLEDGQEMLFPNVREYMMKRVSIETKAEINYISENTWQEYEDNMTLYDLFKDSKYKEQAEQVLSQLKNK